MKTSMKKVKTLILFLGLIGFLLPLASVQGAYNEKDYNGCEKSARELLKSSRSEAQADYSTALAKAHNLPTKTERKEAKQVAKMQLAEDLALGREQFKARMELCEELDEDIYHPVINPDDFVDTIDNPYLPLIPGTTHRYEKQTDEGLEVITVIVTNETKEILGVTCIVVRDTVTLDGVLIEDTLDYFAQDTLGNVWYFGELAQNFENGELANLDGSWTAGVEGAKPGIVMKAAPQEGNIYRQEFFLGEAEDVAKVISTVGTVSVPVGDFNNVVITEDFSPLEPDHVENKYYAPSIGLVLEVDPETGERTELVDIQP